MNDFTKEDLTELIKYISHPMWTDSDSLRIKIQSMIDSYYGHGCTHESDGTAHVLLCNPPIYTFKCKKCGKSYR